VSALPRVLIRPAILRAEFETLGFVARLNLVTGELVGFTSEFIGTLAREGRI